MSSMLDAIFLEAKNFYLDGELMKCIHSLDEAIASTLSSYNKGVTLCFRAFCRQEELSKWKKQDRGLEHRSVVKDMRDALAAWETMPLGTILPEHKSVMMVLLNNMIDLASIMALPRLIASAQKCMFALLEPTERKKNLARLWEWRRISHAMCASPVNKLFMEVLSKYCGEASRGVDFWLDSLEEPALIVGWKHNLSYTFSALCCNKPNLNSIDLKSFHGGVTIGEAATTASAWIMDEDYSTDEVSSNDDSGIEGSSIDYRSKYMAAYIYYDLCERLASNGLLIDALPFASLAAGIRLELHTKIFDEQSQGVLTQLWSLETVPSDLQSFYLSPWNVLKCFLESLLQIGTMYEVNGNEEDAIATLEGGEALSNTHNLPIFKILFSSALGKVRQKGKCDVVGKEKSERASECFEDFKYFFSCETCKWTIKATLMLDRMGDHANTDEKVSLSKLLESVPDMSVSYSADKVAEYEMCICNKKGCWQCIPLDVMNSGLVQNFVDLKCKFVCRRLCLGLLARSGNHCENHEISNNIFQRASILLNRDQVLDTSVNDWESYLPLLVNDVPGDSLSIERAELLHYIYFWKIVAHEPSHDFVQEDELLLLLQAFVLCREVPVLFQKVSRLVAVIFSYIASKKPSQLLFEVPVKELASYFQQISVGSRIFGINSVGTKKQNPCIAPASVAQLKKIVQDFFTSLPRATTIICISLLDSSIAGLLQRFFGSCPAAWIIASCLRFKKAPTVLFLPVSKTLGGSTKLNEAAPRSNWIWDFTVIDKLAPEFKSIMSEMSVCLYGGANVPLKRLDDRIREFLKNLEESWFEPLRKVITKSDLSKPIFFVLDLELQALPLESMPLFQDAEIYRTPIGFMFNRVDINKYPQKKDSVRGLLPSVNIMKAFYLSNPEGLKEYEEDQKEFENQFQCKNIKGYAGSCPDDEILNKDLKSDDLFLYLGHGDGTRFIAERQILRLKRCAAVCLLGCNSAAVKWRGLYFPRWTPNAYLCAGAPFAVCSLWFLYDPDIGEFLKELLSQKGQIRIGAFIRDFRLAYKYLPYVFGAALVCYGAPTFIHSKKKKKINRKQA